MDVRKKCKDIALLGRLDPSLMVTAKNFSGRDVNSDVLLKVSLSVPTLQYLPRDGCIKNKYILVL